MFLVAKTILNLTPQQDKIQKLLEMDQILLYS